MGLSGYPAILSGNDFSVAHSSSEEFLTSNSFYVNQKYIYYLSRVETATSSGSGAGSEVGAGTNYSGVGGTITLRYMALSCGLNTESNQRSVIMSLMSIDS